MTLAVCQNESPHENATVAAHFSKLQLVALVGRPVTNSDTISDAKARFTDCCSGGSKFEDERIANAPQKTLSVQRRFGNSLVAPLFFFCEAQFSGSRKHNSVQPGVNKVYYLVSRARNQPISQWCRRGYRGFECGSASRSAKDWLQKRAGGRRVTGCCWVRALEWIKSRGARSRRLGSGVE